MKFTIPPILSKSLLKIAANAFLSVGCLLMVSCDGGLLALGANEAFDDDSNSSPPVSEQGLAPIAINGVSITLIDSGLVVNIAENGVDWYTARVAVTQGSILADGDRGTLTYKASGDKGFIEYVAFDGDNEKATLTFTSESTGTYLITDDGANETGSFTLIDTSQLKAPSSIAGLTIRYELIGVDEIFGFTLTYSEDGETFDGVRDGGGVFGDSENILKGSFTYSAAGNIGDFGDKLFEEFEVEGGPLLQTFGGGFLLTFFTETAGTFLAEDGGFPITGTFEIISGP